MLIDQQFLQGKYKQVYKLQKLGISTEASEPCARYVLHVFEHLTYKELKLNKQIIHHHHHHHLSMTLTLGMNSSLIKLM